MAYSVQLKPQPMLPCVPLVKYSNVTPVLYILC